MVFGFVVFKQIDGVNSQKTTKKYRKFYYKGHKSNSPNFRCPINGTITVLQIIEKYEKLLKTKILNIQMKNRRKI